MLPQKLLDVLVCPACRTKLEWRAERQDFRCAQCRRLYPVRDGIPVLLVEEATPES